MSFSGSSSFAAAAHNRCQSGFFRLHRPSGSQNAKCGSFLSIMELLYFTRAGCLGQPEAGMKVRLAIWATAGFLVAMLWALYSFAAAPIPIQSEPIAWTLARLTCPVVFASFYLHFAVGVYWVLLANTVTYALVGLLVENRLFNKLTGLRRRPPHYENPILPVHPYLACRPRPGESFRYPFLGHA